MTELRVCGRVGVCVYGRGFECVILAFNPL